MAVIIQVIHIPLDHRSEVLDIFQIPDITNALSIIQYLSAITGIFLIVKFIIDKIFNKK